MNGRKLSFTVSLETTELVFTGGIQDDGTLAGSADVGEMGQVKWKAERVRAVARGFSR